MTIIGRQYRMHELHQLHICHHVAPPLFVKHSDVCVRAHCVIIIIIDQI